jgi:hypothetical protein
VMLLPRLGRAGDHDRGCNDDKTNYDAPQHARTPRKRHATTMMLRAGSIKAADIHIRAFMAESFLLPCQSRSCHRPA